MTVPLPLVFRLFWVQRSDDAVGPDFHKTAAARRDRGFRRRAVDDDRRLAVRVVAGDDAAQRLLERRIHQIHLEQTRRAHAAADAHRDDRLLGAAALAFHQHVAGETRAGHAEGMADGDGAAIDVVFLRIDAELVAGIEALRGEGLVQFPQIDVIDLQAMTLRAGAAPRTPGRCPSRRACSRRRPSP